MSADTKKHTPTPWVHGSRIAASTGISDSYGREIARALPIGPSGGPHDPPASDREMLSQAVINTAFIVEAVNSHEALKAQNAELVEALGNAHHLLRALHARIGNGAPVNADDRPVIRGEIDRASAALAKVKP